MVSSEFIPFRGRHGFVRPNPNLRQWQAWIELKKHDMLLIATSRTLNSIAEPRAHVIANKARISNWRTKKCSSRVDGTRLIFLYFARFLSQRMKHFNESSLLNACVSITKLCACRKYEPIVVARKQAVIECWLGRVYSFRLVLRNYSAKRISKCLHVSSVHVFIWINRPRLIKHLNRIEQQIENCAYVLRNRWATFLTFSSSFAVKSIVGSPVSCHASAANRHTHTTRMWRHFHLAHECPTATVTQIQFCARKRQSILRTFPS